MLRLFILICGVFCLVSCSTKNEYSNSKAINQTIKPISVPPGVTSGKIKSYYPIPNAANNESVGQPSLVPPGAKKIGQ